MNLYKYVSDAINETLGFTANLEIPKNRDFGDFSTNAAMVGAKKAGKNPRELANEIIPKLQKLDFVEYISVAGPGFINIKIKDDFILNNTTIPTQIAAQKPLQIDLDYGSYNIGKALHIGHLRTTVVGDTFNRIANFVGHKTISYNHIGDWGRPIGLIIAWILEYGIPKNVAELNEIYPKSTMRAKQDEDWLNLARKITSELQSGNQEYLNIYNNFISMSLKQMDDILIRLNAKPFDKTIGEHGMSEYVPSVIKILKNKQLLQESDGALVVNVRNEQDNAPMPPLMIQNSANAQTYDAWDLAAIYYRSQNDKPDTVIYFTDSRQTLHFQQLFRVAKMADITTADLIHVGFGTITGTDGKPFKTRDGDVASLSDILNMVTTAVQERVAESNKKIDDNTINQIAVAAVKFNDLIHDVKSDYVFDAKSITNFEGRTGPYILYTAVRLAAVLKRANTDIVKPTSYALSAEERNLLIQIMDFEHMILSAFENRATDMLANYTYDLCQLANNFYHNCPILRDDITPEIKAGRLYITKLTFDTLATAIDLMGLQIPDEM
ncbi:MAG: arginine--tRNA ligase [Alphaproteobacteria bacterium]|nr:arginine--tRNA ligase [Alphaproteobacteria bacterium]